MSAATAPMMAGCCIGEGLKTLSLRGGSDRRSIRAAPHPPAGTFSLAAGRRQGEGRMQRWRTALMSRASILWICLKWNVRWTQASVTDRHDDDAVGFDNVIEQIVADDKGSCIWNGQASGNRAGFRMRAKHEPRVRDPCEEGFRRRRASLLEIPDFRSKPACCRFRKDDAHQASLSDAMRSRSLRTWSMSSTWPAATSSRPCR